MCIKNYFLPFSFLCVIAIMLVSACAKDDDGSDDPITVFEEGIFIANLSSELSLNGSVSFYDRLRDEVANDIFVNKNNVPLSGPLYSIHVFNNKAYLVQEEAGQIIVADPMSMEQLGNINDLDLPHYFLPVNSNKAYVSQWGNDGVSGSIKVIDLNTNTVVNTILTRGGPEQMLKKGNEIYVTMTGGYLLDSVVTVINSTTDEITNIINVGFVPQSLQLDQNGDIWVLCRGLIDLQNPNNNTPGKLARLVNGQVATSIELAAGASDLVINNAGDALYFLNPEASSWVYEHPITSTSLSTIPFIDIPVSHLAHDPLTDWLIGADVKSGLSNGDFILFDGTGAEQIRFEVGVRPSEFWVQ